jgi:hypothetical protein
VRFFLFLDCEIQNFACRIKIHTFLRFPVYRSFPIIQFYKAKLSIFRSVSPQFFAG